MLVVQVLCTFLLFFFGVGPLRMTTTSSSTLKVGLTVAEEANGGPSFIYDFRVKAVVIDDQLRVVAEECVKFDTDLPHYRTRGGVHIAEDKVTVTTPTTLWLEALDLLLDRMNSAESVLHRVAAISGSGQQHGSVYWQKGSGDRLLRLQPDKSFAQQLSDTFSVPLSPTWMDSSTSAQCRHLESEVGGPEKLAAITGSRGYERFTGNQIAKVYQLQPAAYHDTERISLVSSFAASLLIGKFAPIDDCDGCGMNLLDFRCRDWSDACLDACAPGLRGRLGRVVSPQSVVGSVSGYLCDRYFFNRQCHVVAFTGDNPASLVGLAPKRGDVMVSLGTSDTVFLWLDEAKPSLEGHVFTNPVHPADFMALLCFKNGSLTRERIRDEVSGSWDTFDKQLKSAPPGNGGNIGIYFDVTEIQPVVQGVFRFNTDGDEVDEFPPSVEVRALVEGQCMSRRVHAEDLGLHLGSNIRVIATGGASCNMGLLQVLADVFNAPVYIKDVINSAALGSAYRAMLGSLSGDMTFEHLVERCSEPVCAVRPSPGSYEEGFLEQDDPVCWCQTCSLDSTVCLCQCLKEWAEIFHRALATTQQDGFYQSVSLLLQVDRIY